MSDLKTIRPVVTDPETRRIFSDIDINIKDLDDNKAKISAGSGAPTGGSANDLYVDTTNNRLYVNVAGTWKYSALT